MMGTARTAPTAPLARSESLKRKRSSRKWRALRALAGSAEEPDGLARLNRIVESAHSVSFRFAPSSSLLGAGISVLHGCVG